MTMTDHEPVVSGAVGDLETTFAWASVTKVATALCLVVAVENGLIELDVSCGPRGSTLRQLLSHSGGIAPGSPEALCDPGTRRIYSNAGFEIAAGLLEQVTGTPFSERLRSTIFEPLGMSRTTLEGSPATGIEGPVAELARLLAEVMDPTLITAAVAEEMRTIQFPDLVGTLPGFGRQSPCPWGLGFEVKGTKAPHWTGREWSQRTVGHFGQAGGFLVVDPEHFMGVATLGDVDFGAWAADGWPPLLDDLLEARGALGR